ncbi:uncharacterized protein [Henckelia pumila]|uniref:uncharacterized protein n=1 Tax=Henckelia pumila TaxID=405737 RepID=UPI003C6DC0A2
MRMFGLIADCTIAKDAWDALQEYCEGTESVRRTILRFLNTKFENLRMDENETIADYDKRLREIATEAFALGGPIASENMVNKVLWSLPKRFNGKIWALEEVKDTSKMKLIELISILQVFEMNFISQEKDKRKSIVLQASKPSYDEYVQFHQEVLQSDLEDDSISLITNKFNDYLNKIRETKKIDQKLKAPMFPNKPLRITGPEQTPKKFPDPQKPRLMLEGKKKPTSKNIDTLQCHSCQGFGHYANECANTLRKGMNTSLSDEEIERNKTNSILSKENTDLKADVSRLEVMLSKKDLELSQVKDELVKAKATLAKFKSSTTKLDSLLMMERYGKAGLGFENSKFEIGESSKALVFVKESAWYFDSGSSRHMTGSRRFLTDYVEKKSGKMTYEGGSKGNIIGKGTLNVAGLPKLRNVLHVQGHLIIVIKLEKRCLVDTQK